MILVGQYDSPYVRRVAIALHLAGLGFERNTMSVFADAEAMRRINPLGRIPSLVLDDGEILIDSAAILDHLDEVVGADGALVPARGEPRRRALRLVALASGVLDKAGAIVYERTLRPPDKVFPAWIERCEVQVAAGLDALEAATGAGWYLGPRVMLPDVAVGCTLDYLRFRAAALLPAARYPRLIDFVERFDALPAAQQTTPAPDEVMPAGLDQSTGAALSPGNQ